MFSSNKNLENNYQQFLAYYQSIFPQADSLPTSECERPFVELLAEISAFLCDKENLIKVAKDFEENYLSPEWESTNQNRSPEATDPTKKTLELELPDIQWEVLKLFWSDPNKKNRNVKTKHLLARTLNIVEQKNGINLEFPESDARFKLRPVPHAAGYVNNEEILKENRIWSDDNHDSALLFHGKQTHRTQFVFVFLAVASRIIKLCRAAQEEPTVFFPSFLQKLLSKKDLNGHLAWDHVFDRVITSFLLKGFENHPLNSLNKNNILATSGVYGISAYHFHSFLLSLHNESPRMTTLFSRQFIKSIHEVNAIENKERVHRFFYYTAEGVGNSFTMPFKEGETLDYLGTMAETATRYSIAGSGILTSSVRKYQLNKRKDNKKIYPENKFGFYPAYEKNLPRVPNKITSAPEILREKKDRTITIQNLNIKSSWRIPKQIQQIFDSIEYKTNIKEANAKIRLIRTLFEYWLEGERSPLPIADLYKELGGFDETNINEKRSEGGWIGLSLLIASAPTRLSEFVEYAAQLPNQMGLKTLAEGLIAQGENDFTGLQLLIFLTYSNKSTLSPAILSRILDLLEQTEIGKEAIAKALVIKQDEGWTGLQMMIRYAPPNILLHVIKILYKTEIEEKNPLIAIEEKQDDDCVKLQFMTYFTQDMLFEAIRIMSETDEGKTKLMKILLAKDNQGESGLMVITFYALKWLYFALMSAIKNEEDFKSIVDSLDISNFTEAPNIVYLFQCLLEICQLHHYDAAPLLAKSHFSEELTKKWLSPELFNSNQEEMQTAHLSSESIATSQFSHFLPQTNQLKPDLEMEMEMEMPSPEKKKMKPNSFSKNP